MATATPDIIKVANKLKRELIRGNDNALRILIHAYAATMKSLQVHLVDINALIKEADTQGKQAVLRDPGSKVKLKPEQYSINWLFRQQRYEQLIDQCKRKIDEFSKTAEAITRAEQDAGIRKGLSDTRQLILESLGEVPDELVRVGISVGYNYVPVDSLINITGFLADGSPLSYKFASLSTEIAQSARDVIASNFAQGQNPRKIARAVKREFGKGIDNVLVTCRTEGMRAYREASRQSYKENKDILKGWIRSAARQTRTCAACWALDGTFHKVDEILHDHPSGRCVAIPVTKSWAELYPQLDLSNVKDNTAKPWDATQYFNKLSDADQRKILGKAKYELYKSGEIALADIPSIHKSKVWGDVPVPGKLSDVKARAQARKEAQ